MISPLTFGHNLELYVNTINVLSNSVDGDVRPYLDNLVRYINHETDDRPDLLLLAKAKFIERFLKIDQVITEVVLHYFRWVELKEAIEFHMNQFPEISREQFWLKRVLLAYQDDWEGRSDFKIFGENSNTDYGDVDLLR